MRYNALLMLASSMALTTLASPVTNQVSPKADLPGVTSPKANQPDPTTIPSSEASSLPGMDPLQDYHSKQPTEEELPNMLPISDIHPNSEEDDPNTPKSIVGGAYAPPPPGPFADEHGNTFYPIDTVFHFDGSVCPDGKPKAFFRKMWWKMGCEKSKFPCILTLYLTRAYYLR
jgi:hypothetical protein